MNLKYHIYEHNIICPYCDGEYRDDDYEVAGENGEEVILECGHCHKKFTAHTSIVYCTYSSCNLNNEEHILEETHIKGFFTCKNCEYSEHIKSII